MNTLDSAIRIIRIRVNSFPSFKKIPSINTIGAIAVQNICREIICLVRVFLCFVINISRKGARIFNGGTTTNNKDDRLNILIKE
jgi:hypothetical protein